MRDLPRIPRPPPPPPAARRFASLDVSRAARRLDGALALADLLGLRERLESWLRVLDLSARPGSARYALVADEAPHSFLVLFERFTLALGWDSSRRGVLLYHGPLDAPVPARRGPLPFLTPSTGWSFHRERGPVPPGPPESRLPLPKGAP